MKNKIITFADNSELQIVIKSILTKERVITITESMDKENNRYYAFNPLPPIKDNPIIHKPKSKHHK